MTHTALLRVILFSLVLCAASRTVVAAQTRYEFSEVHMGMPVRIVMYAPDDSTARHAARAAFARIAYLDAMKSDYRLDSELNRLNASAGSGEWFKVSPELFEVLSLALEIAEASDGAFDPTVGPFVALWREARNQGKLPPTVALDFANELVSWHLVALDTTASAVRLARTGMLLDLGGIAKGYIVESAANAIQETGIRAALVQAGGEIVVGDAPPGNSGWLISLPETGTGSRPQLLSNAAISSSGSTFQYIDVGATRFSHVIDPRTGLGMTSPSISHVVARRGAIADAIATGLAVYGVKGVSVLKGRLTYAFDATFIDVSLPTIDCASRSRVIPQQWCK